MACTPFSRRGARRAPCCAAAPRDGLLGGDCPSAHGSAAGVRRANSTPPSEPHGCAGGAQHAGPMNRAAIPAAAGAHGRSRGRLRRRGRRRAVRVGAAVPAEEAPGEQPEHERHQAEGKDEKPQHGRRRDGDGRRASVVHAVFTAYRMSRRFVLRAGGRGRVFLPPPGPGDEGAGGCERRGVRKSRLAPKPFCPPARLRGRGPVRFRPPS